MMSFGKNFQPTDKISGLPFNIQQFLADIQQKYGYISTDEDVFKKTFDKKRKLSAENLFPEEKIIKLGQDLKNKKIVIVKNETIDSSLAYENALEMLTKAGINIENTVSVKKSGSPVSYKDISDVLIDPLEVLDMKKLPELSAKNESLDDYLFICIGKSLNSLHKITELTGFGANVLIIDNTRIGNDYIPSEEIEYLLDKDKDKVSILNPYLSDYENKQVSNSVMLTKVLSKVLEGKKVPSKKTYTQRVDIFNGLSIISNRDSLDSFENRILAQKCIESLNEPSDKNIAKKLEYLKEALKIDTFDVENINIKLIPFIYSINEAYERNEFDAEGLTQELQWTDFSQVIDFIFAEEINENEFKQILRAVIYMQDSDRTRLSDDYAQLQEKLEGNTDRNVFLDYDETLGKLIFNSSVFPDDITNEDGTITKRSFSFSEMEIFANKIKNDSFKNVFIVKKGELTVSVKMTTYEKYGSNLKDFVKKHKADIQRISGEDHVYSLIMKKELFDIFQTFVKDEFTLDIGETKKNTVAIKDFSFLSPDILSIVKRDLGITNPSKIVFGLSGTVYKFDEDAQNKFVVIKDEKGDKRNVSVNDYYFNYIKDNYPIGDNIALHIKSSLRTDARGDLDNSFSCVGLGMDDTVTFKQVKKEVLSKIGKDNDDFNGLLENFSDKSTYEVVLSFLKTEKSIDSALIKSNTELSRLHKIAETGKAATKIEEIKESIQDFIINKNQSLDTMLDRERSRLLFGGTHIVPFLIKEGNEVFLNNKEDRRIYNELLDQRNKLFFQAKDIFDWFGTNFGVNEVDSESTVTNNGIASVESIKFIKETQTLIEKKITEERSNIKFVSKDSDKEMTLDQRQIELSKSMDKLIVLLSKQKELKEISSQINSLRTTVRNTYYIRYTQKAAVKKESTSFTDLIFNKDKASLAYHDDKFNDKLFYSNFYDSSHFVNTVKSVFKGKNEKIVQEISNFLNANNYNSTFDTIIDSIKNGELDSSFNFVKLVSLLTPESKIRFVDLISQDKYSITLKILFNLDTLEPDREVIKKQLFTHLGLINESNTQKAVDEINEIVIKKVEIEKKLASMIRNNKKPQEIINWLVDGDVDGTSVTAIIQKGLVLTRYLDTQFLMLAYLRDLGVQKTSIENGVSGYSKSAKLLANQAFISTLAKDLLFMKNDDRETGGARYAFKILSSFKNKDTIVSAMDKEMSLFLSDTKRDSINKNKSIAGYFKDIFNIYGLQSTFISDQLTNSAYVAHIQEEVKKVHKELLADYGTFLTKSNSTKVGTSTKISFADFLTTKIESLGSVIDENGFSTPAKITVDNHNIGLRKYGLMKIVSKMENVNLDVNSLEDFRQYVSEKLAGSIDYSSNNYITSQSESFFIFNIQRKLFDGFNIQKARDISYKDITKEIFSLLKDDDKEKLYAILSKTNSYGKNIIPDFVIRNKVGNIVGVGEVFGGHSDDSENYDEVKKIKIDILNILKKAGINTFFCNYDEKNKNGKINEYLYKFGREVNKSPNSIVKSDKEYNQFIEKNNLNNLFETKVEIVESDIDSFTPVPVNKLSMSSIVRFIETDGRKPLFFDTETTGFARKSDPTDFRGASIFQLAYSDRTGQYVSKEFKEIKGPLVRKIEELTHQRRTNLLQFGKDPIEGMSDFLFEIIGDEMKKAVMDPSKIKNLKRSLERARNKFAIVVGHNSFAFDAAMVGNMLKRIYLSDDNKEFFVKNPGIKIMYNYFITNGFDMGDTLNYTREVLDPNKNVFLGEYALGNENKKLGNLYKLSQMRLAELRGEDMTVFKPKLEAKIAKCAHNAQFDIEMTKEVFDYIVSSFKSSEIILTKESDKYVEGLKKGGNVVEEHNNFLKLDRDIKILEASITNYNELLKLIILMIGKMDTEVEYADSKISINRISDYKKVKYDVNKVMTTLESYGLTKEEIEDAGLIKEVISKKNAKILTDFLKNVIKDEGDLDIYDYLDEKLVIRDHGFGKVMTKNKVQELIGKLKEELPQLSENDERFSSLLNESIIRKDIYAKEKKKLEGERIKQTLIIEKSLRKIFNLRLENPDEYNKMLLTLKEEGITINEMENRMGFNIKESLEIGQLAKLNDMGIPYDIIESVGKADTVKITDINKFNEEKGLKWANDNKIVYYTKKDENNKDALYLYKRGDLNGSYTLRRSSIVNIEKMKEAMTEAMKLNIPQEVKDQLLEIMIERKVKNKAFLGNFKNSNVLFKELESRVVKIVRASNYLKTTEK